MRPWKLTRGAAMGHRPNSDEDAPVRGRPRGGSKADYDENTAQRDLMRRRRAEARDLAIPEVKNPKRRKKYENSLYSWGLFYCGEMVALEPSPIHKEIADEIQERMLFGGRKAIAAPRGIGKDTWVKIAAMWAVLNGHLKFLLCVFATYDEAEEFIEDIKEEIETNELLCEDYPEVCVPARSLEGAALRAKTLTVNRRRTFMRWEKGQLRLPSIKGSVSSGTWMIARGIDGKIRGLTRNKKRPDFYLCNDLESENSIRSDTMTEDIENKIEKALGGVAGPGKKISAVMLCTIMKRDRLADKYTNPKIKHSWAGARYKAMIRYPDRTDLWDRYMDMRTAGQQDESDPKGRKAHAFYLENREEMDRGALVVWDANFIGHTLPDGSQEEVSALEHLYNIIADNGEEFFATEHQNDPPIPEELLDGLTTDVIRSRLNGVNKGVIPDWATRLTVAVDVGKWHLHYVVAAANDKFSVAVTEHEIVKVLNDADEDARRLLKPWQASLLTCLRRIREACKGYVKVDGSPIEIDLGVVDARWETDVILMFCKESGPRWRPCFGHGRGQGQKAFNRPKPTTSNIVGAHWYGKLDERDRSLTFHLDADHWKIFVHDGFRQVPGTEGGITLYGSDPREHNTYSKHLTAERWDVQKSQWEKLSESNHFFDATGMACAALDMLGVKRVKPELPTTPSAGPPQKVEHSRMQYMNKGRLGYLRRR